jgi:hypothetical protein
MLVSQYPKLSAGYGKGDNDYDRIQEALKDYWDQILSETLDALY